MPQLTKNRRKGLANRENLLVFVLGLTAAIALVAYCIPTLQMINAVTPDGFIPQAIQPQASQPVKQHINWSALSVLVYAFTSIPVIVLFTIRQFKVSPAGMVTASSLLLVSMVMEVFNSLPMLAASLANVKTSVVSPEVALRFAQSEATRFMGFDVAGFTLIYMCYMAYGVIFFRKNRSLGYLVGASIVLFVANVPFLWIAPWMAVILMVSSILLVVPVPVYMAFLSFKTETNS
jgi:hypothetical protein